jgi:two-component system, NtrC family, nitrogen regulation sensor histidine kinase NtrY
MASRSYRIDLILRAVALCATLCLFAFLLASGRYPLTSALAGVLAAAEAVLLVAWVDRRNRSLARFLAAVRDADFSRLEALPAGASFDELRRAYAETMRALGDYRLERERERRYLEAVAERVGVGFAVVDAEGRTRYANEAFREAAGPPGAGAALLARAAAMRNGDKETIVVERGGERARLLATVRDLALSGERLRVLSIQDIGPELDASELDAWQRLARVLTHEIMNSIAPISSLAYTATGILRRELGGTGLGDGGLDALSALDAIGRRSRGLLSFVEGYRKVLGVPQPAPRRLLCGELVAKVGGLMEGTLRERRIALKAGAAPERLALVADEGLVEQALINLVKNSIEALEGVERPAIEILAGEGPGGRAFIEVADNGRGIPEGELEKVFVPFYTTKAEGSGVGLGLCRQIMRLHGGSIGVRSVPGERTAFTLRF